jgi:hypothetical protein
MLNFVYCKPIYEQHVLQLGAKPVTMPEEKPWAQKAVYIEDLNGNIIRLGSEVAQ